MFVETKEKDMAKENLTEKKVTLKKGGEYFFKGNFLKSGSVFELKEVRGVNAWCVIDGELYPFRLSDVDLVSEGVYFKGLCSVSKKMEDGRFLNVSNFSSNSPYIGVLSAETAITLTPDEATEFEFMKAYESTVEKLVKIIH